MSCPSLWPHTRLRNVLTDPHLLPIRVAGTQALFPKPRLFACRHLVVRDEDAPSPSMVLLVEPHYRVRSGYLSQRRSPKWWLGACRRRRPAGSPRPRRWTSETGMIDSGSSECRIAVSICACVMATLSPHRTEPHRLATSRDHKSWSRPGGSCDLEFPTGLSQLDLRHRQIEIV